MDSMQVGCKVGMSGCEGFGHTNGCGALVRCSLCCFSYDLSTEGEWWSCCSWGSCSSSLSCLAAPPQLFVCCSMSKSSKGGDSASG